MGSLTPHHVGRYKDKISYFLVIKNFESVSIEGMGNVSGDLQDFTIMFGVSENLVTTILDRIAIDRFGQLT